MGILCSCTCCNILDCCSWCGWKGHSHDYWKQSGRKRNANWMEQLIKISPDVKLRDCIMIGTHNSSTGEISGYKCFSSIAKCTDISIYKQLIRGARYLDIRLASNGKNPHEVITCHGPLNAGFFSSTGAKNDLHLYEISNIIEQSGKNGKYFFPS